MMNAAIWFGAFVFHVLGVSPVLLSNDMRTLLGARNFPYYGEAIELLAAERFYIWHVTCAGIALAHITAEWIYLGRYPRKFWLGLLVALFVTGLLQLAVFQPKLSESHQARYSTAGLTTKAVRDRAHKVWRTCVKTLDGALLISLGIYVWRVFNPPDSARFVPTTKFRG
jgi:hypothetical protein